MPRTARRQTRQEIMAEAREPYARVVAKLVAALQECVTSDTQWEQMHGNGDVLNKAGRLATRIIDINYAATTALREVGGLPRNTT
jgi:hypothetical protein